MEIQFKTFPVSFLKKYIGHIVLLLLSSEFFSEQTVAKLECFL